MKKILIALVALVVIVAIAATVFVGKMDNLIADAVRTEGTAALGAKVDVASVVTDLQEGTATINGLSIANAPGYQAEHAVVISTVLADIEYETQIVERIAINSPVINAELKGKVTNFDYILENMPEDEEEVVDEEELQLTIKLFELRQAKVNLITDKLGNHDFIMDDLVMENLTGTVDEISDQISGRMTGHIATQVKNFIAQTIEDLIPEDVKQAARDRVNEEIGEKIPVEQLETLKKSGLTEKLKGFKLGRKKD